MPPVHIAVVAKAQIVASFEAWLESAAASDLRTAHSVSNVVLISGPSRTGDIANIPVRGVHGPGTVHILIV